MSTFTAGTFGIDFDQLDIGSLTTGAPSNGTSSSLTVTSGSYITTLTGSGLQLGTNGWPTAGTIDHIQQTYLGQPVYDLTGLAVSAVTFFGWVTAGDNTSAKVTLLAGGDLITGSGVIDRLRGFGGSDTINAGAGNDFAEGGAGDDQVFGGAGNDVIIDSEGTNYLRGDEGDDQLTGGIGFDDINGNMGNDTVSSGPGDDYAVGGRDNDLLAGDAGVDIVWGNLGNDTCDGGDGADQVRGGQGDDIVNGGAGDDFVSGDRGSDTITGGAGADRFHGSQDAGLDRVTDFTLSQGDRVQLDPGTTYTVTQSGADTVIDMGGGNQMILVGVQMSTLTPGWIFLG